MKKLISFIKNWFIRLRLRRRGIDLNDLKISVEITKFLENMPRSYSSLNPKVLEDFTTNLDVHEYVSKFFEVENENIKK